MNALLSPKHYFCESIFRDEMQLVFQSGWHFVGFTFEVSKDEDWLVASVGGHSITIQNFEGSLRALHNVCSHRFSLMRTVRKGNGRLICPYHGWIYNELGVPCAIPSKPRFRELTTEKIQEIALRNFAIDTCGQLIFVRASESGQTLREFLDTAWSRLETYSNAIHSILAYYPTELNANWKLVMENGLEGYHTAMVHPDTLGRMRSNKFHIELSPGYSYMEEEASTGGREGWSRFERVFESRPIQTQNYSIYTKITNFSIDTIKGATFFVACVEPISSRKSRMHGFLLSTKLKSEIQNSALVKAYNNMFIDFGRAIFEEDKAAVERVQAGVEQSTEQGMLSEEEERVWGFQRAYISRMGA